MFNYHPKNRCAVRVLHTSECFAKQYLWFMLSKNTFFCLWFIASDNGLIHIMHRRRHGYLTTETVSLSLFHCISFLSLSLFAEFFLLLWMKIFFIEISYLTVCYFHHHLFSPCLISFDPSSLQCPFSISMFYTYSFFLSMNFEWGSVHFTHPFVGI